jgi:predicted HTH transcriptional regulator
MTETLAREESQTFERKASLSLRKEALQALCGMVNGEPAVGEVLFGVSPTGQLRGVEPGDLDKAQRSLAQAIRNGFDPPLMFETSVISHGSKRFLLLSARRSGETPLHEYDGRAYIREGTSTRKLNLKQRKALDSRRNRDAHSGPWRCDKCRSMAGMLVSFEVTDDGIRKTYDCGCGGEYWPAV